MKWLMKLPIWARYVIGLSVALGMFVLIWRMNVERDKNELVWATGAEAMRWKRVDLPIRVYVDTSFDSHRRSVYQALADMNRGAGCKLMVLSTELPSARIHIQHEACATANPSHLGCTWHDRKTGYAIVQVGQPGDITQSYVIFFHELTHVWGLAHDGVYPLPPQGQQPAMFVPITATNAAVHSGRIDQGAMLPTLSDKDAAAISARYCD